MDLSNYNLDTRMTLHIDHIVQNGEIHPEFEGDVFAFALQDITSVAQVKICVSLCRLCVHMEPDKCDFLSIIGLVQALLQKVDTYLIMSDETAGRA